MIGRLCALLACVVCCLNGARAAEPPVDVREGARAALIPFPREVTWHEEQLELSSAYVIWPEIEDAEALESIESTLEEILDEAGVQIVDQKGLFSRSNTVLLALDERPNWRAGDEGYRLIVAPNAIALGARTPQGLFYGLQTLRQLIQVDGKQVTVPCCSIVDWPAFPYRGFMHDVGRNFQSIDFLKQQIDVFAQYKLNVFHWHLTDNPGYRIECLAYPELNDPKNYRQSRHPGKFYTYDEINEFIGYCAERHILVIPEIDMPGHSEYFGHTFGCDMQSEKGLEIVEDLLREFCAHVDSPIIHIGSDEVNLRNADFLPTVAKVLREEGRDIVVWRPGGLPDREVITQLWTRRDLTGLEGIRQIDSRASYINHMDPFISPLRLFMQQPCDVPAGDETRLGGIICCWPDVRIASEELTLTQNPVFPALLGFAERIWRGAEEAHPEYWAKLPEILTPQWRDFVRFEEDLIEHRDRFFEGWPFPYVQQAGIPWLLLGPFDHEGEFDRHFGPEKEIRHRYDIEGETHFWRAALGATIHLNHFFGFPGHIEPTREGTVYALTYIHSDRERLADFWIQFGTTSTSTRRNGGNPPLGQWSPWDGRIWVNHEPIAPPKWNHPGPLGERRAAQEIAFTNESYHFRPPTKVKLQRGWNQVLLRVPFGQAEGYRGGKWMFTCVPIEWDGEQARELEGVHFGFDPLHDPHAEEQE